MKFLSTIPKRGLFVLFAFLYLTSFLLFCFFIYQGFIWGIFICGSLFCLSFPFILYFVQKHPFFSNKKIFFILIGVAFLMRLLLVASPPESLSDDVYRYLWDGTLIKNGIHPFRYEPQSQKLNFLHQSCLYEKLPHKEYKTIYPPLAQLFFLIAALPGSANPLLLRLIFLLLEVLFFWLLWRFFRRKDLLLLYSLFPLLIIESYIGTHIDFIAMLFLFCAFLLLEKKYFYRALLFLLLSGLVKYISLAALPVFLLAPLENLRRSGAGWKRYWQEFSVLILITAASLLAAFAPFFRPDINLFDQLGIYTRYWNFNSIITSLFRFLFGKADLFFRGIYLLLVLLVINLYPRFSLKSRIRLSLLALLFLAGAFFPWYAILLVPFNALSPKKGEIGLLSLLFLSYSILIAYKQSGVWQEIVFIPYLIQLPCIILLIFDIIRGNYVPKQENCPDYSGP